MKLISSIHFHIYSTTFVILFADIFLYIQYFFHFTYLLTKLDWKFCRLSSYAGQAQETLSNEVNIVWHGTFLKRSPEYWQYKGGIWACTSKIGLIFRCLLFLFFSLLLKLSHKCQQESLSASDKRFWLVSKQPFFKLAIWRETSPEAGVSPAQSTSLWSDLSMLLLCLHQPMYVF